MIEGYTKDITEIKREIAGVKENVAESTNDIVIIKDNVTENTRDIAEIKEKVGGIERRLDSLDTDQKVISVDIRAINGKREVKEEIYALKGHLNLVEAVIGKT